jgi:hypothetical protein
MIQMQNMAVKRNYFIISCAILTAMLWAFKAVEKPLHSKFVTLLADGTLQYIADARGNTIPDFSRVGYHIGDEEFPQLKIVKSVKPAEAGSSMASIQHAIDEVSCLIPDANGFRGAVLLKKGTYHVEGTIHINQSGIVLMGEGESVTKIIATGTVQRTLISIKGDGHLQEINGSRTRISDPFVPVGTFSFHVESSAGYRTGDRIVVYRPGTPQWINAIKMDQIVKRPGTKPWKPSEYDMKFERSITKVEGNKITIDNPVFMQMEDQFGGGEIYKASFNGRISETGISNMSLESEFLTDTAENHGWTAIEIDKAENCWVDHVTSRYFGFGCVSLQYGARNVTVSNSKCLDAKSVITGSRRYSFNNNGQQNLFVNCHAAEGRHDFVTGKTVCGPNVFYNCTAIQTHADIGPHQRWSAGTLYDHVVTDGEIAVQDRGNYGTGHGWAGVTQVLWNCTAAKTVVQSPWASGTNYCIGQKGEKKPGRFHDRPDGEWDLLGQDNLQPLSLYMAQFTARHK